MSLLYWVIILPLIGCGILLFLPSWDRRSILVTSLGISSITFILSLFLWVLFDSSTAKFQFTTDLFPFISKTSSLHFLIGLDGISLFFVIIYLVVVFDGFPQSAWLSTEPAYVFLKNK